MRTITAEILASTLLSLALAPGAASAQTVDPATTLYTMDYLDGVTLHGSLSALSIVPPYGVLRTLPRSHINGALTLDPTRGIIYGGSCCLAGTSIEAYDASLLEPVPSRDIALTTTGSVSMKVDAVRRELFVFDTVARTLRAVSLADATYGMLTATTTITEVPAEPSPTSVGDMIAVDTASGRIFLTGGDGGPLVTVDISGISGHTGSFGAVTLTGSTARRSGNSAGSVTVDVAGRRVFFIPATGTVRVISADPPYAMIRDIAIAGQRGNDCGLFYDRRNDTLFVGRGTGTVPVAVVLSTGAVTTLPTGVGNGLTFTGIIAACPSTGPCAACTASAGCPAAAPVCDTTMGLCRGCSSDTDCRAPTAVCLPSGACGACTPTNARSCASTTPACATDNTCVLCTTGNPAACAMSADGHACQASTTRVFCGCATDADCGGATSGRMCDASAHLCIDGCSPAPGRNGCPMGQFCTSDDTTGARAGTCTTTCNFGADCMRTMPTLPYCLVAGDAGTNRCAACLIDIHCASAPDGQTVCAATTHACVQCTPSQRGACRGDMTGAACLGSGRCGCGVDEDCSAGRMCDPTTHACVARPDAAPEAGVDATTDVASDVVVSDVTTMDAPADASTPQDAGLDAEPDVADAGPADAQDVATSTDVGQPTPPAAMQSGGCGCAVANGQGGRGARLWALLGAVLLLRRRVARRRAA